MLKIGIVWLGLPGFEAIFELCRVANWSEDTVNSVPVFCMTMAAGCRVLCLSSTVIEIFDGPCSLVKSD